MARPIVTQHESSPPATLAAEALFVVGWIGSRQLLSADARA
jgi:hypothetical protein